MDKLYTSAVALARTNTATLKNIGIVAQDAVNAVNADADAASQSAPVQQAKSSHGRRRRKDSHDHDD